jgi:anti-sigma B factor antagonist
VPDPDEAVEPSFSVSTSDDGLSVRGEVDVATAPRLAEALREAASASSGDVTVDVSGVTFMDSTGLSALVEARRGLGDRRLVLSGASPMLLRLLEITGLADVFVIEPPRP